MIVVRQTDISSSEKAIEFFPLILLNVVKRTEQNPFVA